MISTSVTRIEDNESAIEQALVVKYSRNMPKTAKGLSVYYSKEFQDVLKRYKAWKKKTTGKRPPSIQSVLIIGGYDKMLREMGEVSDDE